MDRRNSNANWNEGSFSRRGKHARCVCTDCYSTWLVYSEKLCTEQPVAPRKTVLQTHISSQTSYVFLIFPLSWFFMLLTSILLYSDLWIETEIYRKWIFRFRRLRIHLLYFSFSSYLQIKLDIHSTLSDFLPFS